MRSDDAAALRIEPGPPAKIVIAEIEDVSCAGLDGHGFGRGDVIDIARCDDGVGRPISSGVIDEVQLRAPRIVGEPGPIRAQAIEPEHRRIEKIGRIGHLAAQPAMSLHHHRVQQAGKYRRGAQGIGIRKRRALRRRHAQVIKPRGMALQLRHDLAQAHRPRQLAVKQRHELALRRKPAHRKISFVLLHKRIEHAPRNMLQNPVENAILMPHGVDPFSCPDTLGRVRNRVESTSCPMSTKTQPDSRGTRPAMTWEW